MTTYALTVNATPDVAEVLADCRLIANLPLSGQPGTGYDIYAREYHGIVGYWIIDRLHDARVIPRHFDHLHEVLWHALRDLGWGDYTITPPEGIDW